MNDVILLVRSYVRKCIHTYLIKNIEGIFVTDNVNKYTPLFCQNICQCVSKHYKYSIKKFHQYAKCIIHKQTEKGGQAVPQRVCANVENCNHLLPLSQ